MRDLSIAGLPPVVARRLIQIAVSYAMAAPKGLYALASDSETPHRERVKAWMALYEYGREAIKDAIARTSTPVVQQAAQAPTAAVMLNLFGNLPPEQQRQLLDAVSADQRRTLAELTAQKQDGGEGVGQDQEGGGVDKAGAESGDPMEPGEEP